MNHIFFVTRSKEIQRKNTQENLDFIYILYTYITY